jgi:anti-sigma regulatory factor (Ser/Thr protein kinase)
MDAGTDFIRIVLRNSDYRAAAFPAFRYRFQEDEEWVNGSAPEILLNNPNAGTFRCEVSYRKPDGSWSVPEMLCTFVVNPPFYATWYFITLLFLIGAGGMYLLFRLRLRQLKRRHYLQDKINQLEQKALRAQMNPHFIFNSLNSIQSFLVYEENEKAERYLLRFAHLIRLTLNNSREPYITVESEMDSLQRYLELEQMRFKDKFTFEIRSSLTREEMRYGVPPMLIQPFVENAVLHGFKTITEGGRITVHFESVGEHGLDCSVEDNGIGRKATMDKRTSNHKSFGTRITEERLVAFRQKYGDDFRITITDKEIDGKPSGTLVKLRVPVVLPGEFRQENNA